MSRLIIDAHTYLRFHTHLVENYTGLGFSQHEAAKRASADMRECYDCDDAIEARNLQKDKDEEREGDWTR